ncbi:MAG TPA: Ig-like domain-containing protein, partial [Candidatus Elarobacter sp.]
MNTHARRAAVFAALVAALFATGCTQHAAPPQHEPLPTVSPLPSPAPHAPIASVAPQGEAGVLAQVRVRFSDDLIALQRLESPDETAILAHFSIEPALPGRFRFLTPKMIGFEPDRAWPAATRVRITIGKGLKDVHGHELADDVSWTFETPGIELDELPGKYDTNPTILRPAIHFTSNVPLDRASLEAHARIRVHGDSGEGVALTVPPDTASPSPSPGLVPDQEFDPSQRDRRYLLVPATHLEKGKQYDVVIGPGVLPRDGNLPSDREFTGKLNTHDDLRFVKAGYGDAGRFTTGDPKLTFTTQIDAKSLGAITLQPAPPKGTTPFAVGESDVNVNTALLAPNSTYSVTIAASLQDKFGQKLGSEQHATFRTGDLSPDVWAPDGTNLFPSSRDVRLNVVAVNAPPGVQAKFRALQPADVVQYPDASAYGRGEVLGDAAAWPQFDAHGPHNVERTIEIPLRAKLGAPAGVLAYGVRATLPRRQEPFTASGTVQLTDLGVFAQWFPDGGTVRVNRIADGTAAGGAHVDVYPSQADNESKTGAAVCATATTDAAGIARFAGAAFARCAATDKGENNAPAFVTVVRLGADWTYVRTSDSSGAYTGDFYNGWSSATPLARGTIFSDRRLYQPGETAQMTAAGWFLVNGTLRRGKAPSYAITLEQPNGDKHDLGRRSLDEFGEFTLPVAIAKNAPLGSYTVRAAAGNGETISGTFRVAEFKPPNFKVDLALDHQIAQRGATITGTATNAYLFGAPLAGASTAFTVTRSPTEFTPKGREAYSFGRRWFWPEEQPDAATDVLGSTVTDDANGKAVVTFPVTSDLPYPMTYEVDAETTDASNISVADSKSFTALPSDTLIGVKTDDVGTAGTPLKVTFVATDPSGASRSGTNVHVELQRATYSSATKIVEGAEEPVQSVSYATVASADAASAAGPATVSLTPDKPGTYRVRADVAGASDTASETDVEVFVGGS